MVEIFALELLAPLRMHRVVIAIDGVNTGLTDDDRFVLAVAFAHVGDGKRKIVRDYIVQRFWRKRRSAVAVPRRIAVDRDEVGVFVADVLQGMAAGIGDKASRIFSAVVLLIILKDPKLVISIRDYGQIRPNREVIGMVLRVGIPAGIENSMFQFGKLVVQSTVSTLGTTAMAAQAMTHILNLVECMPSQAICIGLLTVVGQCMGAGRVDEARKHTRQFCMISEVILVAMGVLIVSFTPLITRISGMTPESAAMTMELIVIITIVKALIWVPSFTLPSCLRAAGDVRFSAVVSIVSMWVFRVGGGLLLCRGFGVGLIGLWVSWFADWLFRMVLYIWRYRSGKWETKRVITK